LEDPGNRKISIIFQSFPLLFSINGRKKCQIGDLEEGKGKEVGGGDIPAP
jgi:hypothetical protein